MSERSSIVAQARSEVTEWDEFGQGFNATAELVVCICGEPYPMRDHVPGFKRPHYCPADNSPELDPCPMGCGRTSEDPYGGPCNACWEAVYE